MIEIKADLSQAPLLLKKAGVKAYLQAVKNSQNKALNAAKKVAENIAIEKYGLPKNGPKFGPESPYDKPSVKSVLENSLVRTVGGIEAGVPSKLFAEKKRLSAIRFLSSERRPIQQKGIPRSKRRQTVGITLGRRTFISKKKFVQKGNSSRLHIFRSKETTRKWLMIRNTISSVASLLRYNKADKTMLIEARKKFISSIDREVDKRLWK